MRRIQALVASLLVLALLAAGCGDEPEPAEDAGSPVVEPGEQVTDDAGADADGPDETVAAVPDEVVLYPEGTLDPQAVDPDVPVPADVLFEAYFAWNGMEVTVAGYPDIWYGDSSEVEGELELVADPDSNDELLVAELADPSPVTVYRGEPVAVRGTLEMTWTGLEITGAEIVEPPADLEPVETSAYVYDAGTVVPVDQMVELATALEGVEVAVVGRYHSTTTSTTSDGTTIRIDLTSGRDPYTKLVACEMADEISPESDSLLVAEREGVVILGTVEGESFDMVGLEGCVLQNR